MPTLKQFFDFVWDDGNFGKNEKHQVTDREAEEVFFDNQKVTSKDLLHSQNEVRFILIGKTKTGRLLYTVFTVGKDKIRIISARDINKKEVQLYEKKASSSKV